MAQERKIGFEDFNDLEEQLDYAMNLQDPSVINNPLEGIAGVPRGRQAPPPTAGSQTETPAARPAPVSFFPPLDSLRSQMEAVLRVNTLKYSNDSRKKTDNVYIASLFFLDDESPLFLNNEDLEEYYSNKKKQAAVKLINSIFEKEYIFNKNNFNNNENFLNYYLFYTEIYNSLNLEENIKIHKFKIVKAKGYNNRRIYIPYGIILKISNENYDLLREAINNEYEKNDSRISAFLDNSIEEILESLRGNPYVRICDYSTFRSKIRKISSFLTTTGALLQRPKKGTIVRGINYVKTGKYLRRFINKLDQDLDNSNINIKNIKFTTQYDLFIYFENNLSNIKFIYKKNNNSFASQPLYTPEDSRYNDLLNFPKNQQKVNQIYFLKNYEEIQSNIQIRMFGLQRKKQRKKIFEGLVQKHLLPPGTRIEALDCVNLSNKEGINELWREIFIQKYGTEQANKLLNEDIARSASDAIRESSLFNEASTDATETGGETNEDSADGGNKRFKDSLRDSLKPDFGALVGDEESGFKSLKRNGSNSITDALKVPFESIAGIFEGDDFANLLQTAAITTANVGFATAAAKAGGALDPEKFIKKNLKKIIKGEYLLKTLQSIPPGVLFTFLISLEVFEFSEQEIDGIAPWYKSEDTGGEDPTDTQENDSAATSEEAAAAEGGAETEAVNAEPLVDAINRRGQRRRNRQDEAQEGSIRDRIGDYRERRGETREGLNTAQENSSFVGGLMRQDSTKNQVFNISEESLGRIGVELRELEAAGASEADKAQFVISVIISDILTCESERQDELQERVIDFVFDILGFDVIMEDFNDIAQFLNAWDARNIDFCDPPNIPFADFIYNLFIGNFDFKFGNIGDFLKQIFAALLAALLRLIMSIVAAILNLILQAILQAVNFLNSIEPCDVLNFLRDFSLTLQTRMCGELNKPGKFAAALGNSLYKEGFSRLCIAALGEGTKPEDIAEISCAMCSILTPEQYLDFLSGNPNRETINVVGNYIKTRNSLPPEQRNTFANCDEQEQQETPEGLLSRESSNSLLSDDEMEDFVIELGAFVNDVLGEINIFDAGIDPGLFQNVFTFCPPELIPINKTNEALKESPLEGDAARQLLEEVKKEQEENIDKLFDLLNNPNSLENEIQKSMPPMLHPTNILMGHEKKPGVNLNEPPDYDASGLPIVPRDEEPYGSMVQRKFDNFINTIDSVSRKSAEKIQENITTDYIEGGSGLGILNAPILPISPLNLFSLFSPDPKKNWEKLQENFNSIQSSPLPEISESNLGFYNLNFGIPDATILFKSSIDLTSPTFADISANTIRNENLNEIERLEYGLEFKFKFGKTVKQCKAFSLLDENETNEVVATLQTNSNIENILLNNSANIVYLNQKINNSLPLNNFTIQNTKEIFIDLLKETIKSSNFLKTKIINSETPERLTEYFSRVGSHNVDFNEYSLKLSASYFKPEGDFSEEKTLERFRPENQKYIKEYLYIHDSDLAILDATMEMYATRSFIKTSALLINSILNIDSPIILSDSTQSNIIKAFYVQNVLDELEKDDLLIAYVVLSADLLRIKTGELPSENVALRNIEEYLTNYLRSTHYPESKLNLYNKQLKFIDSAIETLTDREDSEDNNEETLAGELNSKKRTIEQKINNFDPEEALEEGAYVKITDEKIFGFLNSGYTTAVNILSVPSYSRVGEIDGSNFQPTLQKAYYAHDEYYNKIKIDNLILNINFNFKIKEKNNQLFNFAINESRQDLISLRRVFKELAKTSISIDNVLLSLDDFWVLFDGLGLDDITELLNNFNVSLNLTNQIVLPGESVDFGGTWDALSNNSYVILPDENLDGLSFNSLNRLRIETQLDRLPIETKNKAKIFTEIYTKTFALDSEKLKNKTLNLFNFENSTKEEFKKYIFKNFFVYNDHKVFYDFIFNLESIIQLPTIYYAGQIKKVEDSLARKSNFSKNRIFTNNYKDLGVALKSAFERIIE